MTYAKAKEEFGQDSFLFQRCFTGLFVNFVLETGFGFNANATLDWSVEFKLKVGDILMQHTHTSTQTGTHTHTITQTDTHTHSLTN